MEPEILKMINEMLEDELQDDSEMLEEFNDEFELYELEYGDWVNGLLYDPEIQDEMEQPW